MLRTVDPFRLWGFELAGETGSGRRCAHPHLLLLLRAPSMPVAPDSYIITVKADAVSRLRF